MVRALVTLAKRTLSTSAVHQGAYTWYAAWQMARTNGANVENMLSDRSSHSEDDRGSCPENAYKRHLEEKVGHAFTEGSQAKSAAEVDINAVIKRGAR